MRTVCMSVSDATCTLAMVITVYPESMNGQRSALGERIPKSMMYMR